jgi:hypothetical protein
MVESGNGVRWLGGTPLIEGFSCCMIRRSRDHIGDNAIRKTSFEKEAMRNVIRFLLIPILASLGLAVASPAQAQNSSSKITAAAAWTIPSNFAANAHAACTEPSKISECFIGRMAKAGASASAVNFARRLYKQNGGDLGIMTGFQPMGPVACAWITYPLRANTNFGLLFVNGEPGIVNVEDLKLLDQKTMKQSGQFQDLKKGQFPKVDVWPGDRDGTTWPNSQPGPNGGVQFAVDYPLINGCHACARAGRAIFDWNFDAQGKFLGTTFQGMTPPPLP